MFWSVEEVVGEKVERRKKRKIKWVHVWRRKKEREKKKGNTDEKKKKIREK